jgi:hypothetical protein
MVSMLKPSRTLRLKATGNSYVGNSYSACVTTAVALSDSRGEGCKTSGVEGCWLHAN